MPAEATTTLFLNYGMRKVEPNIFLEVAQHSLKVVSTRPGALRRILCPTIRWTRIRSTKSKKDSGLH